MSSCVVPLASWNSSIVAYRLKFTRMGTVPSGLWCASLLVSDHTKLLQHWPSLTYCQCRMKWSQANITRSITLYWQSRDTMIPDRRRVDRENLDLCFSRIPVSLSQLSGVHNLQTNNWEKSFCMRESLYLGNESLPVPIVCYHPEWHLRHGDFFQFKKFTILVVPVRGLFWGIFLMYHVQNYFISISPLNPRDVFWEDISRLLQKIFLVLCLCHVLLKLYECFRPCLK